MATITPRRRKSGTIAYTAQIRLEVNGRKYTESKTLTDRAVLEKWAADREEELRTSGEIESKSNPTVGQVLKWYKEDFAPTGRTKVDHINFLINHEVSKLDAVRLTPAQLIKHARSRTASPATITNDFVWIRIAFRAVGLSRGLKLALQAVEDAVYILRKEKVIGRPKQRDRRPALDELNKLLNYFSERDGRATIPMVDMTLFALFSGRREAEITRLRRFDIDRRRHGIMVRDMKHPRLKVDTFCQLTESAMKIIDRQPEGDTIFPYNSKSVSAAFTRACAFLEIKDLRFHDLRHELVSHLFELEWDIPKVAAVSGHKSWSSLQRYTHLREYGYFNKYEDWEWLP